MPIVPDVAAVQFLGIQADGQASSNTFHVHKSGAGIPDLPTMLALATDIKAWFDTTYRAMMTTADTWQSIKVSQVIFPTGSGPYGEQLLVVNEAGTVSSSKSCPESVCGLISLKTNVAKKYARGHLFLPPAWDKADLGAPRVWGTGAVYKTNGIALAAKFAAGCGPTPTWTGTQLSGWTLAIYSKQQDKVAGPAVTDCAGAIFSNTVRWLRSRERGTT